MRVTFMLVHLTADSAAVAAPAAVVVADVESEPADSLDLPAASFGLAEPRSGMKSISPVLAAVAAAAGVKGLFTPIWSVKPCPVILNHRGIGVNRGTYWGYNNTLITCCTNHYNVFHFILNHRGIGVNRGTYWGYNNTLITC
uniref:Secreted protein n=1 Tax=Cacopsylla melanoneura TaxID=428564 RepID=A0A8D8R1K7_9HEMI